MAALASESVGPAQAVQFRALAACSIGSFLNLATLILYPYGVFTIFIAQDLGWPRREVAGMMSEALLVTVFMQPVVGWVVNRFPARPTALVAMVGLGLGTLLLAFAPSSKWLFPWVIASAILLSGLASPTIYSAILAQTFDRRRGLALGISTAFTGLGTAVLPILCSRVSEAYGWRVGYGVLTVLAAAALLVNAGLLPGAPEAAERPARRDARLSAEVFEAFKLSRFWKMAAVFFLLAVVSNAIPFHLPLILKERGASSDAAALSLTVLGVAMIFARPLFGYFLDHLSVRLIVCVMLVGPLVGSLALLLTTGTVAASAAAGGFGLAIGGEFVTLGYMISRGFPMRNFGALYGWIGTALAAGVAAGPMGIKLLLEVGRGYAPPLVMIAVASVAAIGLTLTFSESDFPRRAQA